MYKDRVAVDGTEGRAPPRRRPVIVGLTTAPEMGIPGYTNSLLHGITRSPWNLEATPGGLVRRLRGRGRWRGCSRVHGERRQRLDPIPSSYSGLPGFEHVRAERHRPCAASTPG